MSKTEWSPSREDPALLFDVLAKLGEGSYGSVYKAVDRRDQQTVAIKVIEVEKGDVSPLQNEIEILKNCKSEHVVQFKGCYEKSGHVWIVMEYCEAGSVGDLMHYCERSLTEPEIAEVCRQALMGLQYLHSIRKLHRDIKSGNLLLTSDGMCKLADFGVSVELNATVAKAHSVVGTPYWMAPEVLQSLDYDGRADVWSLGITAIEMAEREPPLCKVHPMRAIFMIPNSPPPNLSQPNRWSPAFLDFLQKCLVKDPSKRGTAKDLLQHPFVASPHPEVIRALVESCRQQIEDGRQAAQDEEAEEEEAASDKQHNTDTASIAETEEVNTGTAIFHENTMVGTASSYEVSGTVVLRGPAAAAFAEEKATPTGTVRMSERDIPRQQLELLRIGDDSSAEAIAKAITTLERAREVEIDLVRKFYNEKIQELTAKQQKAKTRK